MCVALSNFDGRHTTANCGKVAVGDSNTFNLHSFTKAAVKADFSNTSDGTSSAGGLQQLLLVICFTLETVTNILFPLGRLPTLFEDR